MDEILAAVREGDLEAAVDLAEDAHEEGIGHPIVRMVQALDAMEDGDPDAARRLGVEIDREISRRSGRNADPRGAQTLGNLMTRFMRQLHGAPERRSSGPRDRRSGASGSAAFGPDEGVRPGFRIPLLRDGSFFGEKFSDELRRSLARPVSERIARAARQAKKAKERARAAAAARPSAPPPPPPKPVAPEAPEAIRDRVQWMPAAPPEVAAPDVELRVDDVDLNVRLASAATDGLRLAVLARRAIAVSSAEQFDTLLALRAVRGVREFPHQVETVRRVLRDFRGRALLADEVGLGKTIEAGLIIKEYLLRGLARSVLILCPPSLVEQWKAELAQKFDLDFAVPGKNPERFFESGDLLLCSYTFARRAEHAERAQARRFDLVVVDEAHHVKNRNTLGFRLVDGLKRRFLLLLTATPVQNQLDELYNLVTLLRPGHLGTQAVFSDRFVVRGEPRQPKDRDSLRALLQEVMIRNTRALVDLRLPPRFVKTKVVEPTERERELYAAISRWVRDRAKRDRAHERPLLMSLLAEAGSSPAAVLSTLEERLAREGLTSEESAEIRGLQVRCAEVGETSKGRVLLELLAEALGDKTVVFAKYRATLAALEGLLAARGVPAAVFHGGLTAAEKEAAIESFRTDAPVLLSTEIGGEGRNLQFCRRIVNFDLPWNPFSLEQRIGRLHRIGQEREVFVVNLCAHGTAEDYLLRVLDEKLNMFELVIGELDMILGDLEGDLDIPGRVYSIWTQADGEEGVRAGFDRLADDLVATRRRYEGERAVDKAIFGRDFEVV
ncbi:MAG: DEAD/DEAH box helicase [Deltaproteobacteria bacterium]|nr:DEAD/DEAH box helicase [Deltaproteobacteria bacterium]